MVHRRVTLAGWVVVLVSAIGAAGDDGLASAGREIPAPLAPFEYLIGGWKGTGVPTANRVRGWGEAHAWAWKFEKGRPVGLTVTMQGDKVLARGQLLFDPVSKHYTLGGADPSGKPVAFSGAFETGGKALTLDRIGTTPGGARQRLTLFPNSNLVRYTVWVAEQEPGAPQFKRTVEVGMTKEGEAFAAGSAAAELPKCIVTGGAATMNVSYQGKTYPLCCSGCRDEFNENPEKYIKKAALRAEAGGKTAVLKAAPVNKDDGAFDGLGEEPKPSPGPAATPAADAPKAEAPRPPASGAPARAAALLRLGQNLEKARKSAAALGYYRQVVKDYPGTPAARTAAERIKALSPRS